MCEFDLYPSMTSKSTNILIRYDRQRGGGDRDNYYHFLLGFLLPTVDFIIKTGKKETPEHPTDFYVESCGAVMDELFYEVADKWKLKLKILPLGGTPEGGFIEFFPPRWDLFFLYHAYLSNFKLRDVFQNLVKEVIIYWLKPQIFLFKKRKIEVLAFKKVINTYLRDLGLNGKAYYGILKRSVGKLAVDRTGKSIMTTFRNVDRRLSGLDKAQKALSDKGVDTVIFEPGKETLMSQIMFFQNCRGIIAIRGAELANVFWMKPKSKVIVFDYSRNGTSSPAKAISKIIGLDYYEIRDNISEKQEFNTALINKVAEIICER